MKTTPFFTILILIIFTNISLANTKELSNLTIFAPSSIALPIVEISRIFSKEENISIATSFEQTALQVDKISKNTSADIFISANQVWISKLKQQGLIDIYSLTNILQNNIALVLNKKNLKQYKNLLEKSLKYQIDFLSKSDLLIISNPNNTSLGLYTKQILQSLYQQNLANYIIKRASIASNSRNITTEISNSKKFGILYSSDLENHPEIKVIHNFSYKTHEPIIYQAAVIAGENMSKSREFVEFLKSKKALTIFKKYGFLTSNIK